MSVKEVKALGRHLVEELNKGKAAAMAVTEELYTNDVAFHGTDGKEIHGLKDYKEYNGLFYDAFPDAHFTIDDVIVEGDMGAWRLTLTGTFKAGLHGIQPTNKRMTVSMIIIDRFAGGKIVEEWDRWDRLGAYQQLGVIPAPGKGK